MLTALQRCLPGAGHQREGHDALAGQRDEVASEAADVVREPAESNAGEQAGEVACGEDEADPLGAEGGALPTAG